MESVKVQDPKDDKIVNKDDSVTNKDGNNDLEKGEHSANQTDAPKVLVELSDNDNPGVLADESASNKGQGPAGENL